MVPLVTIHTAWEDQRHQVCQCMLYATGYPLGLPVPYESSGTLTPLIYHALSGTGKPCSLLVASNSFFLRKSNSWKRTKYRIRRHKTECSLRINTCNKTFQEFASPKAQFEHKSPQTIVSIYSSGLQ